MSKIISLPHLRSSVLPLALGLALSGSAPTASAGSLLLQFDSTCPNPSMSNGVITCGTTSPPPATPVCSALGATIASGQSANLQASCPGATSIAWFDSSQNQVGSGSSFATPALTSSTVYYVRGTNGAGAGASLPVQVSVGGGGGGGGGGASCGNSKVVDIGAVTMGPGNYPVTGMSSDKVGVASFTVPPVSGSSYLTVSAYGGSQTYYQAWVSKTRCDMSITAITSPYYRYSNGINMRYAIGVPASGGQMQFQPGETWYVMIREVSPAGKATCPVGSTCDISVQVHLP